MLQFDDSRYVDAKQYHLASFSTRNSTLNTSLRKPIRMQDFIQLLSPPQRPLPCSFVLLGFLPVVDLGRGKNGSARGMPGRGKREERPLPYFVRLAG